MWLVLLTWISALAAAACPAAPALRDGDDTVTALEQNLKFIVTGGLRAERSRLLADWLVGPGAAVDLLLLSEARLTDDLARALPDWCLYSQDGEGIQTGYRWRPIDGRPSPGGLVLGTRRRALGAPRAVAPLAGRRYRARPTTLVEGFVARLARYHKGWAEVEVDGTRLVWSHTQASYAAHPERGAGGPARGRAGQFDDLAEDLGRADRPLLLTGDLNLLDRFRPREAAAAARVAAAAAVDGETVARFEARTGIHFDRQRAGLPDTGGGTFFGRLFRHDPEAPWDFGAHYDRVGTNPLFRGRHPGTRVEPVAIERSGLRVSDHDGITIHIPFPHPGR